jgi:hypothetical protein
VEGERGMNDELRLTGQERESMRTCTWRHPLTKVVFTRHSLEPTRINREGTVRAYHLYISMHTTGG